MQPTIRVRLTEGGVMWGMVARIVAFGTQQGHTAVVVDGLPQPLLVKETGQEIDDAIRAALID